MNTSQEKFLFPYGSLILDTVQIFEAEGGKLKNKKFLCEINSLYTRGSSHVLYECSLSYTSNRKIGSACCGCGGGHAIALDRKSRRRVCTRTTAIYRAARREDLEARGDTCSRRLPLRTVRGSKEWLD
uniref:Gamma-glutamylcyclotransferase AIG2-like domain-containing protein n=1 Tax=Trichogramma kaykai TaxID=54128 RepID=A0ABD2X3I1_9HYME